MHHVDLSSKFQIIFIRQNMLAAFAFCKRNARLILKFWLAFALRTMGDKPLSLVEFVVVFNKCSHARSQWCLAIRYASIIPSWGFLARSLPSQFSSGQSLLASRRA